jgi:protein ImuB
MFCCLVLDPASPVVPGALEALARACSPRLEPYGDTAVVFDAGGLGRVIGTPDQIGAEVRRLAADHGLLVRVCVASTMAAAWIIAHARPGVSVVEPGDEAAALAPLPLATLRCLPDGAPEPPTRRQGRRAGHYRLAPGPPIDSMPPASAGLRTGTGYRRRLAPSIERSEESLSIFARWGLRTLGDLACLSRADLRTRLGPAGVRLHEAACGEDPAPLVPADEPRRFLERLELDWPIEGLEPLSFVLGRLCDALSASLERADRGAVAMTTRLKLVNGQNFARVLTLPAPMRDARVLRTLVLLDLESHPPEAAIDAVELEVDVTPGQIVQGSLLTYALPSPENLATLLARLNALMGESRVGAPALVETHDERAVAMQPFQAIDNGQQATGKSPGEIGVCPLPDARCLMPLVCLRRFRLPIPARVVTEHGAPKHVEPAARGVPAGRVLASAGPWRTSGRWWTLDRSSWDRDEWDIELTTGVFRLARDRVTGRWEIEGVVD